MRLISDPAAHVVRVSKGSAQGSDILVRLQPFSVNLMDADPSDRLFIQSVYGQDAREILDRFQKRYELPAGEAVRQLVERAQEELQEAYVILGRRYWDPMTAEELCRRLHLVYLAPAQLENALRWLQERGGSVFSQDNHVWRVTAKGRTAKLPSLKLQEAWRAHRGQRRMSDWALRLEAVRQERGLSPKTITDQSVSAEGIRVLNASTCLKRWANDRRTYQDLTPAEAEDARRELTAFGEALSLDPVCIVQGFAVRPEQERNFWQVGSTERLTTQLAKFFDAHPGDYFSAAELATQFGSDEDSVALIIMKLEKEGKIEKNSIDNGRTWYGRREEPGVLLTESALTEILGRDDLHGRLQTIVETTGGDRSAALQSLRAQIWDHDVQWVGEIARLSHGWNPFETVYKEYSQKLSLSREQADRLVTFLQRNLLPVRPDGKGGWMRLDIPPGSTSSFARTLRPFPPREAAALHELDGYRSPWAVARRLKILDRIYGQLYRYTPGTPWTRPPGENTRFY
jgi:hypothetical protein